MLKEAEGLAAAGRLWVFGGFEGDGFTHMGRITLSYEPGSNRWARHADIPISGGISHCGQTTDGSSIYLLGGMQASSTILYQWRPPNALYGPPLLNTGLSRCRREVGAGGHPCDHRGRGCSTIALCPEPTSTQPEQPSPWHNRCMRTN